MHRSNRRFTVAFVLATATLCPAAGAAVLVPEQPIQFERISLRREVDSCAFNPSTVEVRLSGGIIQVLEQPNACLLPGPPALVDIQLGAYPAGTYRVEIRDSPSLTTPPLEQLNLVVRPLVHTLQSPAEAFPLTDYSGHWWAPNQNGWGLSLHQGAANSLFGVLSVFGADHAPEWFTLQAGAWSTPTRWSGKMVRTSGPAWISSQTSYDASIVHNAIVGTVSLDFGMLPGSNGAARLSYTIDGTTINADILRARIF